MKKPASITPAEGLRNWHDVIDQHANDRAITPTARRNRLVHWTAWGTSIFAFTLLLLVCAWALRGSSVTNASTQPSPVATPLQKMIFTSDGVLTEEWAWQFLKIHPGDSLRNIDIFALRQKLLDLKQVKDAALVRELPGTLRITVQERRPWLRIAADNGAGGYSLNLVSRDGLVFEGQDYPDAVLNQLPWLAGATLHRAKEGGFAPIAGMDAVAELLSTARAQVPQEAAQWTVVDLSQFDPRPEAPVLSSLIKVRSTELGELTFLDHNFQSQIQRLAVAVQDLEQKAVLMRGLDLSLDNQVVVEPAVLPTSTPVSHAR
jgi:cell division protein FtsQ